MDLNKFMKMVEKAWKEKIDINGIKGEPFEKIFERMKKCAFQCLEKYKDKKILLVSHGDPILALVFGLRHHNLKTIFEIDLKKEYVSKGELVKLKFQDKKLVFFKRFYSF